MARKERNHSVTTSNWLLENAKDSKMSQYAQG